MATNFAWQNFSDDDKEYCRSLHATFVMAPRHMGKIRLVDLVKQQLEKNDVIFGVAEEEYVEGFATQPQFQTLQLSDILPLAERIAAAHLPHKFLLLSYPQSEVDEVVRALRPKEVVLVRGSWHLAFQRRSTYELLERRGIPYVFVSPFVHEEEAKAYFSNIQPSLPYELPSLTGDAKAMLAAAQTVAAASFDYSFQTGAVLAEDTDTGYALVDAACNEVVPYQTYAFHFGNSREEHLAAVHDANHYDTVHAEVNLLVRAVQRGHTLAGKSLFINLLPCPSCARMLTKTGIKEVIYETDHSDSYAVKLFAHAGIKTRKA